MNFEKLSNDYSIAESLVIGILWFLIQTAGNCLQLAFIDYFYNSGDPAKWRIDDHVSL